MEALLHERLALYERTLAAIESWVATKGLTQDLIIALGPLKNTLPSRQVAKVCPPSSLDVREDGLDDTAEAVLQDAPEDWTEVVLEDAEVDVSEQSLHACLLENSAICRMAKHRLQCITVQAYLSSTVQRLQVLQTM